MIVATDPEIGVYCITDGGEEEQQQHQQRKEEW